MIFSCLLCHSLFELYFTISLFASFSMFSFLLSTSNHLLYMEIQYTYTHTVYYPIHIALTIVQVIGFDDFLRVLWYTGAFDLKWQDQHQQNIIATYVSCQVLLARSTYRNTLSTCAKQLLLLSISVSLNITTNLGMGADTVTEINQSTLHFFFLLLGGIKGTCFIHSVSITLK